MYNENRQEYAICLKLIKFYELLNYFMNIIVICLLYCECYVNVVQMNFVNGICFMLFQNLDKINKLYFFYLNAEKCPLITSTYDSAHLSLPLKFLL
jgi:hypothetical protein